MSKGFIYICSNPSYPELLKIGRTDRTPEVRAKEMSGVTGVPTPFHVEYSRPLKDTASAEKFVHTTLKEYHHNKEFFKVPLHIAIKVVDDLYIQELEQDRDSFKEWRQEDQKLQIEVFNLQREISEIKRQKQEIVEYLSQHWKILNLDNLRIPRDLRDSLLLFLEHLIIPKGTINLDILLDFPNLKKIEIYEITESSFKVIKSLKYFEELILHIDYPPLQEEAVQKIINFFESEVNCRAVLVQIPIQKCFLPISLEQDWEIALQKGGN